MQERKITKVVVSALLLTGKGILVLQRAKNFKELDYGEGLWDLPGGAIEFGEDIFTALNRELKEETGCDAKIETGKIDVITEVLSTSKVQSFRINIVVKCKADLHHLKMSEEHSNYRFVTCKEDISGLDFLPKTGRYLAQYLENPAS